MSYTNSPTNSVTKMPLDKAHVERPCSEVDIDPAEEKALVRKIDLFLLPTIWLMYLLSYMDRTNIGNAKIAGLSDDLKLSSNQYSVALVVFFVFYVVCEIPSNMVLSRTRPSIFLPVIMFLWGGVTVGMAFVKDYHHLVALRCVVGVLEAGFAPGVLLILSSWYKRAEQSKRFAVYISAAILSGAFGGLLAGAITKGLEGAHGLRGWRWLFIVEGVATSGWSIIAHFILPDFPANSHRKFTEREIQVAIARLRADDVSSPTEGKRLSHKAAFAHCFKNWRVPLFTLGYMVIVGSSTLSYFYPTLVQGLGYSAHMAQYMTVPIYLVAFVATALTGYFSDKVPTFRGLIISVWLAFALICAIAVTVLTNFTARYVLLVFMAAALWATNGLSLSYCSSTFGSMPLEARAIGLAFVNAMGNLAQIYGAYLFPAEEKPRYIKGFSVISAMLAFGACVYLSLHILLRKKGEGRKDSEEQRM